MKIGWARPSVAAINLRRATHNASNRGPYTLEIFSDDVPDPLWERDLNEVISESWVSLDGACREVVEAP